VLPGITVDDVRTKEGDGEAVTFYFNMHLSTRIDSTVTVHYATADGSAHAPADYAAASGTVTFAPQENFASVTITVRGNTAVDGDRVFFFNLSDPSNATIEKAQASGTLVDDEQKITFAALPDKKLGDPPFAVSATASSGLPVSFAAAGACTVDGATVTLKAAGQCTITASQAGSALFNPAPPVVRQFTVAP
jgi:hypothetical protein